MFKKACAVLFVALCGITMSVWSQGDADFGDFADPAIPTLRNSTSALPGRTGPYHFDVTHEWIGDTPGTTTVEPDAKPVDEDDANIQIDSVNLNGIFMNTGRVVVPVTLDLDTTIRYLNVAADLNGDGVFQRYMAGMDYQYEWIMVNMPVVHWGETKGVVGIFTLQIPTAAPCAVRATLTTEMIDPALFTPSGWDGSGPSGGFARGETEDHIVTPDVYETVYSHGVDWFPPFTPPLIYGPEAPPLPGPKEYVTPKGPVPPMKEADQPADPGRDLPASTPETAEPERYTPVAECEPVKAGSVAGMPDIKQGPNECVPTSTANSLSYLLAKAGQAPADPDKFNKDLQGELKRAMGTTAANGTQASGAHPEQNKFLEGKVKAKIHPALANGKVTTHQANPSPENIMEAVDQGKDVEVVIVCRDKDNNIVARHMVTVVGYVQNSDGTVDILYHNPNDIQRGEQAGQTVKPPRVHSMRAVPCANGAGKGGLRVTGLVRDGRNPGVNDDGDTFTIDDVYTEELASKTLTPTAQTTSGTVETGQRVTLTAGTGGKAPLQFQWMLDDEDIEGATESAYTIPAASEEDSGAYTCWVYDADTLEYGVSNPVNLLVGAEVPLAVLPTAGALGIMGTLWMALRLRKRE